MIEKRCQVVIAGAGPVSTVMAIYWQVRGMKRCGMSPGRLALKTCAPAIGFIRAGGYHCTAASTSG
jgi:thioredoxin reductase